MFEDHIISKDNLKIGFCTSMTDYFVQKRIEVTGSEPTYVYKTACYTPNYEENWTYEKPCEGPQKYVIDKFQEIDVDNINVTMKDQSIVLAKLTVSISCDEILNIQGLSWTPSPLNKQCLGYIKTKIYEYPNVKTTWKDKTVECIPL
jgi:hypothetical protein